MISQYKELLEGFGWEEIPSKNKIMISFIKNEMRLNYYFTNGTITIQGRLLDGSCETFRNIKTLLELEKIISND